MSENQAKSGVEDIVAGLGVDVGGVADPDKTALVNAGFEFSPVTTPWSGGSSEVGFGCCLAVVVLMGDGTIIGLRGTSAGGKMSSTRGTSNLTACDGSIEDPHKIIFHPRKVPLLLGLC